MQLASIEQRPVSPYVLGALFFLSGASGLLYEVVWVRMLTRILGSTVYATSTVLAAYMAGLALGSWLAGRKVDRFSNPLRFYALLELAIGASALLSLALSNQLVPLYHVIYSLAGGRREGLIAGQVIVAALLLLLPTALMGATLPTLCSFGARCSGSFSRSVGYFYGLNTLGALTGTLSAGFVLIGALGESSTLLIGSLLNLVVGGVAYRASAAPGELARAPVGAALAPARARAPRWVVLLCFAVGGFVSLASEVVWSRMLLVYQGTSIYAFSSMLAVVLTGIGGGSLAAGRVAARLKDPVRALARIQFAIAFASLLSLRMFGSLSAGLFWPAIILLGPLGVLWGVAFPVGAECVGGTDGGRDISDLYAGNTAGCIAGSFAAGFLLIPHLGSSLSIVALGLVSIVSGGVVLALAGRPTIVDFSLVAATLAMTYQLGDPYFVGLSKNLRAKYPTGYELHDHTEEVAGTTTVFTKAGGHSYDKQLWVNGEGMTCLTPATKLMAHLPMALAEPVKDMLIICFGMGTSVRSALRHEGVHVRAVELIAAVPRAFAYFHPDGSELLKKPQFELVVDDGRNDLLMHDDTYDVITIDPPPPLNAAGTVNLYSRDFFALCRRRLRPNGVLCVWIPPDSMSEIKMIMRSYLDVFEHTRIWTAPPPYSGFLLLGTLSRLNMADVPRRVRHLFDSPAIAADLSEWGTSLNHPKKLLDLYLSSGEALASFCDDSPMVTDDLPFTEFTLWRQRDPGSEYHKLLRGVPYSANPLATDPYH